MICWSAVPYFSYGIICGLGQLVMIWWLSWKQIVSDGLLYTFGSWLGPCSSDGAACFCHIHLSTSPGLAFHRWWSYISKKWGRERPNIKQLSNRWFFFFYIYLYFTGQNKSQDQDRLKDWKNRLYLLMRGAAKYCSHVLFNIPPSPEFPRII